MNNINILLALTCEAKPLIKHFKLQRVQQYKEFPMFARDNIRLLVCGLGQINMAAACGWLAATMFDSTMFDSNRLNSKQRFTNDIWLNVGTAGHGSLQIGEGFLVNQVAAGSSKVYYPPLIAAWKGHYSALQTMDQPSHQYHADLAFDMEAYAFFMAAQKFSSSELIQSYKVVSDNRKHGIEDLNAKKLTQLIDEQLPKIESYLNNLSELAQLMTGIDIDDTSQQIFKQCHFTETQQHQFRELWRRWQVLKLNTQQEELDLSAYSNAKQLMRFLSDKLLIAPRIAGSKI